MAWFKVFSKNRVDKEILDLYLEIEVLIIKIDEQLEDYLKSVLESKYYQSISKDKKYYSIQKITNFFKKIKEDYAYCYTIRENIKHYEFHKNSKSRAEKIEIEIELTRIFKLLIEIKKEVDLLDKTKIKENDLSKLVKFVEDFIKSEDLFKKIQKEDEIHIFNIIEKIEGEAEQNKNKNLWLIDQKSKLKILFSQNFSIKEIKYLDLVPLLELKNLTKRSLFINELHKDKTLPVYHYNLEINGKNIHVVPKNYKDKIKSYLSVA